MSNHEADAPKPGAAVAGTGSAGAPDKESAAMSASLRQMESDELLLGETVLEPKLQSYIGDQLRTVYEEVLNEDIPERLLALLQELERKQAGRS
jgi:hypothetical protein